MARSGRATVTRMKRPDNGTRVVAPRSEELYGVLWFAFVQVLVVVGVGLAILVGHYNEQLGIWSVVVPLTAALSISVVMGVQASWRQGRFIWLVAALILAAIITPPVLHIKL